MTTNTMRDDLGILTFVPDLWGDIWMSRHHVLSRLSQRYRVLWVSPPTYVETWRSMGVSEVWSRRGLREVSDWLWVYAPHWPADYKRQYSRRGLIPWLFTCYNACWEKIHVSHVNRLLRQMGIQRVILYLWRPEFAHYATQFRCDLLCYHIEDEYSFNPSLDIPTSPVELALLKRADLVFVHSKSMLAKKGGVNPNTHYMPNGVDFARCRQVMESGDSEPEDLRQISHPRIGYVGHIKRHIDLQLLLAIARRRRDWSLVLLGPVRTEHPEIESDVAALRQESNVHFLGAKQWQGVPMYTKGFDVCLMCYRQTQYTKYIYPMKLHEYLACGKPVVATPLDNLKEFAHVLRFADNPSEWVNEIEAALGESDARLVEDRIAVARENSWTTRTERIAELLDSGLGKRIRA